MGECEPNVLIKRDIFTYFLCVNISYSQEPRLFTNAASLIAVKNKEISNAQHQKEVENTPRWSFNQAINSANEAHSDDVSYLAVFAGKRQHHNHRNTAVEIPRCDQKSDEKYHGNGQLEGEIR